MSSKHFWPEPPKDRGVVHLVEHESGSRTWWSLRPDGEWVDSDTGELLTNEDMRINGYLGVRTPFDEEAERVEFEAWHQGCYGWTLDGAPDMGDDEIARARLQAWLAAKRHERGL